MSIDLDNKTMMKALDWAYEKAINGLPGMQTAEQMAEDYLKGEKDLDKKVSSLIRWQNSKCATSGFICGLGGVMTMPVTIPANLSSVLYVQLRMIAAIAYMGGYDVKDDRVKTLAYLCLAGSQATDVLKDVGIQAGKKFAKQFIEKKISGDALIAINKKVGFRLMTKFGEKGVVNLGKGVPIAGGIIGGLVDGVSTNTIGNVAKKTFINY